MVYVLCHMDHFLVLVCTNFFICAHVLPTWPTAIAHYLRGNTDADYVYNLILECTWELHSLAIMTHYDILSKNTLKQEAMCIYMRL